MSLVPILTQAGSLFMGALPVLGLVAFYLNIRKFGFKVEAYFNCSTTPLGFRVNYIILENKKDKPIFIEEIFLCSNNDIYISLKKFPTPMTLKPFELVSIEASQHSEYRFGNQPYEPPYFESTIVVCSGGKLKPCKQANYALDRYSINVASTVDFSLDGKLYNKDTKYAFIYSDNNNNKKTAFTNDRGEIWGDWDSQPNRIFKDVTAKSVEDFLLENIPWIKEHTIIEIIFNGDNRRFEHVIKSPSQVTDADQSNI